MSPVIRNCPKCGAKLKGRRITTHAVSLSEGEVVIEPESLSEEFWEIECENGHVLTPGTGVKKTNHRNHEAD